MKKIILAILFICCGRNQDKIAEHNTKLSSSEKEICNCIPFDSFTQDTQSEIAKFLKNQNHMENEDNKYVYEMTTKDIKIASKVILPVLCKNGFKPLQKKKFNEILHMKLNISNNGMCNNIIFHNSFFTYLISQGNDLDYLLETEYDYTYDHLYFISEFGFVTELPLLGDLLSNTEIKKDSKICITDNLIHRNKFLFNDSQSSLTWLINNDLDFLELLVREFGYDKNDKINKAVIERITEKYYSTRSVNRILDEEVLVNLFAKKDCSGNLQIREDMMKFISNNYDKQYDTPIELLNSFAKVIFSYPNDYPKIASSFSAEERIKIAAYASYYEQLARYRNNMDDIHESYYARYEDWDQGGFLRGILVKEDNGFLEEIKKNNYYNLNGFEEMLDNVLYQINEQSKEYNRTHNLED